MHLQPCGFVDSDEGLSDGGRDPGKDELQDGDETELNNLSRHKKILINNSSYSVCSRLFL